MLSTALLTTDDFDEIGHTSFDADQPLGVATELVEAVERGLLADKAHTGYALILAAEITDRAGDVQAADAMAELTALRPLLSRDVDAVLCQPRAGGGRAG